MYYIISAMKNFFKFVYSQSLNILYVADFITNKIISRQYCRLHWKWFLDVLTYFNFCFPVCIKKIYTFIQIYLGLFLRLRNSIFKQSNLIIFSFVRHRVIFNKWGLSYWNFEVRYGNRCLVPNNAASNVLCIEI